MIVPQGLHQVAFRRLENGDLLQVLVDPAAGSISLRLSSDADSLDEAFVIDLSAIGLAELVAELTSAAIVVAKHENARVAQQRDEIQQLLIQRRVSQ